jgi:pimeloyl-ACP methyl ester carboxylesterase
MRAVYGVSITPVPYEGTTLPSIDLRPVVETGAPIVAFGGFDSYIEEFLPVLTTIAATGRRVIAFDGPGQGGAIEDSGLPMIAEWERPVAAVLDHYGLDKVTAVGISLGGGLVIRAAAFEPRIARAISYNIMDDELEVAVAHSGRFAPPIVRALVWARQRFLVNLIVKARAAMSPITEWGIQLGMHITKTKTPYDFLRTTSRVTTRHISDRVTQDVLLLAGATDHYVPLHQLDRQAANLTNARSITTRVFTAEEQASSHCQIGNVGLAVRVIRDWLDQVEERAEAPNDHVLPPRPLAKNGALQLPV